MRSTSHNTARRILFSATAALTFAALAVTLTISEGGAAMNNSRELVPATAAAPTGVLPGADVPAKNSQIADGVSSVVRTGATAATATVTGGAAATGASAAALPDTTGSSTVLAMSGVFLTLCAAAAWALLRTSRREQHHTH
jgi:hypothetical protein